MSNRTKNKSQQEKIIMRCLICGAKAYPKWFAEMLDVGTLKPLGRKHVFCGEYHMDAFLNDPLPWMTELEKKDLKYHNIDDFLGPLAANKEGK